MAEPTKLKGNEPVKIKVSDVAEFFFEMKRLRHNVKIKSHMGGHTVSITPDTVNAMKEYIAKAGLDAKSPVLKSVVNSPDDCPNPDRCNLIQQ